MIEYRSILPFSRRVTSQALGQTCNRQRAGYVTMKNGSDTNDTITKNKAKHNNVQKSHTYIVAAKNMDNNISII